MGATLLPPALVAARSPLTDSTDVKIPTSRNEVENSIAVSPINSKVLLASNIAINASQIALGVTSWISLDAGKTWLATDSLVIDPTSCDPAVAVGRSGGTNGRYFVNHINVEGGYALGVHYKDTIGGTTWTYSEIEPADIDKPHLAVNNNTSGSYQNYLICAFSNPPGGYCSIYCRYSADNGAHWTGPRTIASQYDSRSLLAVNVQWGPPASGKVYAVWVDRRYVDGFIPSDIGFSYSTNGGVDWATPSNILPISGFTALAGKTMRMDQEPMAMAVNMATGHLYIAYPSKPAGPGLADVFVAKSTDEGETWSTPVRVHADLNGKDQWHPWIAWDDCSGAVVVTYFDSRNFANNDGADTYMSVSYDDAVTWTDFKVSDTGWSGDASAPYHFAGDYIGLAAKDGIAFPLWSDDREAAGSFKPYISPVYLFGVQQDSVQHSLTYDEGMQLTVAVNWSTNLSSNGSDELVLTSPSNVSYTASGTGSGSSHTLEKTCTCEAGNWKYQVKSARSGFTARGSNLKIFKVTACVD